MANSQSALKRVRQTKTRTMENRILKTRIKNRRKAALAALDSGDADAIKTAVNALYSATDKAVKRGVIHANVSRRMKSNFASRVAAASS